MEDVPDSKAQSHLQADPPPERSVAMNELITQLSSEVLTLRQEMTSVREAMTSQQQQPVSLRYTVKGLCQENQQLSDDFKILKQDMAGLNLYLSEFQSEHRNLQEELKKENDKLRTDIDSVTIDQSDVGKVQKELNDVAKEMTSMREEMRSQEQTLASVKATNSALRQENQNLRTELHNVQSVLDQQLCADFGVLRSNPDQLKKECNSLQAELTKLQADHCKLATDQNSMKKEVNRLRTDQGKFSADIDTVRTVQRALHKDISSLKTECIDPVLAEQRQLQQKQATLTADVERNNASVQESLMRASADVNALETRLGMAGLMFVAGGVDKASTAQDQAMRFTSVKMNKGRHFNRERSRFTAPRAGLYFFSAGVASNQVGSTVRAHIMAGDGVHCAIHGGEEGGSGSQLVRLAEGQEVWLRAASPEHQYADPVYYSPQQGWGYSCYFRGMLALPLA